LRISRNDPHGGQLPLLSEKQGSGSRKQQGTSRRSHSHLAVFVVRCSLACASLIEPPTAEGHVTAG
jgi:hypothetical protein